MSTKETGLMMLKVYLYITERTENTWEKLETIHRNIL